MIRMRAWVCILLQLAMLTGQWLPEYALAKSAKGKTAQAAQSVAPEEAVLSKSGAGIGFPRLGMWWLDAYAATVPEIARYDLLLNEFEWDTLDEKLASVRKLNPDIKVFRPLSPAERELYWEDDNGRKRPNPEIKNLPSSFFLLEVGTTLARSVSRTSKYVYVKELTYKNGQLKFHVGGDIAIGKGESARVLHIDKRRKRLTVKRGYIRAASAHKKGEHVATHIRFWPGSWVMNVTDACPRVKLKGFSKPVNWVEYVASLSLKRSWPNIYKSQWENDNYVDQENLRYDGLILDRFEDNESWIRWIAEDGHVQVDLRHNNKTVTDEVFDASWRRGTDIYYNILQTAFPDLPIIRNNPLTVRFDQYNGQVYETGGWSDPSRAWWDALFMKSETDGGAYEVGCYMDWFRKGTRSPRYVMVEVYEDENGPGADGDGEYDNPFEAPGFQPNYRRMRFSLASTLLGDGYYSYEINTNGHGSLGLMWFDEYDNAGAGKGWLGQPKGDYQAMSSGAFLREFENGLALVNPNGGQVSVSLPEGSWRRIAGTQCPSVNTGEAVGETLTLPGYDGLLLVRSSY